MGNLFENMVVIGTITSRYNDGKSDQLFFFRNSNGVEVDLLVDRQRKVIPYEVKSGRTIDDKHTVNIRKFIALYPDDTSKSGGIIYSGDSVEKYKRFTYRNSHDCTSLFLDVEPEFTVSFN